MTTQRIEQVFPEALLKNIKRAIKKTPWQYGWASNRGIEFTHWNHSIVAADELNGLDRSSQLPPLYAEAWQHIQDTITGPQNLLRCYTNSHTYGVEGYPHTDSSRLLDQTLVIYMNDVWQRSWGGETNIYEGDEIIHSELPRDNRGLLFPGAKWHCARSVSRICPAQRITLMFKFAPKGYDTLRQAIQMLLETVGADKIKHKDGKLISHLLRVYDKLKSSNHDAVTCSAGALHSIFGTNIFKTVTTEDVKLVESVVGAEAVEIIQLFKNTARPLALDAAIKNNSTELTMTDGTTHTVTQNQLNTLCAIEAANLADQNSLKNWPNIKQFLTLKE